MKAQTLAALRDVAQSAARGPWTATTNDFGEVEVVMAEPYGEFGDYPIVRIVNGDERDEPEYPTPVQNAAFIAVFSPQTAIALLNEIDRLRAAVTEETHA